MVVQVGQNEQMSVGGSIAIRAVKVGDMTVEYIEAGSGPLVVLLHGFPDHAGSWRDLAGRLARAGFHAVAPTMRGYSPATRAPNGSYRDWATGSDALALIAALGYETAVVVGHDWGAAAAYAAAAIEPSMVARLVTLAVPYGPGLRNAIKRDGDQQRRSWYWYFFQLPFAAEAIRHDDFAFIDRLWREWSPGYIRSELDQAELKAVLKHDGVLDEVLGYYRQLFDAGPCEPTAAIAERIGTKIEVPTLYLHGENDGCIGVDVGGGAEVMFLGFYRRVVVPAAGHFLHLERPDLVVNSIVDFANDADV